MDNGQKHILKQAVDGEFSPLVLDAACMTPKAFAAKHASKVRPWGHPREKIKSWGKTVTLAPRLAVNVDGTDYLWRSDSLEYDGWDRPLTSNAAGQTPAAHKETP